MSALPPRTDVLVVGAGPCGLASAISLKLQGIDVTIVDQLELGLNPSRAPIIHAKTLELLDTIGCAQALLQRGHEAKAMTIRDRNGVLIQINFGALPGPFKCALTISQQETEEILLERLKQLGVDVFRPKKVVGLKELVGGVAQVVFESGETIVAKYVVGADGAYSTIRRLLNVKFVDFSQLKNPSAADKSEEYPMQFTLADVHLSSPHPDLPADQLALFFSPNGTMGWIPFSDTVVRVMGPVPMAETPPKEPSVDYVNELVKRRGIDGPIIDRIIWGGLFRTRSCIALEFVVPFGTNTASGHGAVILAGDASHVHSPAGGQGMNLGIRDGILLGDAIAVDMAWEGPSISDRLVRFGKERQQAASDITKVMEWIAWVIMTPGTGWRRVMRDTLLRLIGPFGFIQRSIALKLSGMSNI